MNGNLIILTEEQLEEAIRKNMVAVLDEREKKQQQQEKPKPLSEKRYYTAKETATRLRVSLPTLWRYEKEGIITAKRFGRRVLYDRAIVDNIQSTRGRR